MRTAEPAEDPPDWATPKPSGTLRSVPIEQGLPTNDSHRLPFDVIVGATLWGLPVLRSIAGARPAWLPAGRSQRAAGDSRRLRGVGHQPALTQALRGRVGFFLNVPIGLAAILAAPRFLPETAPYSGRLDLAGAMSSTLGVSALVFGIVHSADSGWADPAAVFALSSGVALVGMFVASQRRSPQPLMPLRLLSSRERAGAFLARFLFNGALLSFYFFMSQYLQGVTGYTPLQTGLAFLPATIAAFGAATATSRLMRRSSNAVLWVAGCAAMLIGTSWTSRVSADTGYLAGIALPMIIFGIGQGLGLSTLTTGGMAGVARGDAGVAGGLINVAHHTGGALGLGILVTIFAAAGRKRQRSAGTPGQSRLGIADRRRRLRRGRASRHGNQPSPQIARRGRLKTPRGRSEPRSPRRRDPQRQSRRRVTLEHPGEHRGDHP